MKHSEVGPAPHTGILGFALCTATSIFPIATRPRSELLPLCRYRPFSKPGRSCLPYRTRWFSFQSPSFSGSTSVFLISSKGLVILLRSRPSLLRFLYIPACFHPCFVLLAPLLALGSLADILYKFSFSVHID